MNIGIDLSNQPDMTSILDRQTGERYTIINYDFDRIEQALDIKLYSWQKEYLATGRKQEICPCLATELPDHKEIRKQIQHSMPPMEHCPYEGRRLGWTTAHCIKLALSQGEPLNLRKPEEFSDRSDPYYAKFYYRNMFYKIWHKLGKAGFQVRDLII